MVGFHGKMTQSPGQNTKIKMSIGGVKSWWIYIIFFISQNGCV